MGIRAIYNRWKADGKLPMVYNTRAVSEMLCEEEGCRMLHEEIVSATLRKTLRRIIFFVLLLFFVGVTWYYGWYI